MKSFTTLRNKLNTPFFQNNIWSIASNIIQNLLLSLFFIVIARHYDKVSFSYYVIANTLYSFVLGFSSLGLGEWFVREYLNSENKDELLTKFFKIQFIIGLVFYVIGLGICFLLYDETFIHVISTFLLVNIIFDNIIYVIKYLNIAEQSQKKSFMLFSFEAFLKFSVSCVLYFHPLSLLYLILMLILIRFITLNLFIQWGTSRKFNLKSALLVSISRADIKRILKQNWYFVVIVSLSVVNWRIAGIFTSKYLSADDIADFEVSFKIFSIAYIIPVIVSSTLYPRLIRSFQNGMDSLRKLYQKFIYPFALYGLLSFTFMYSFSDVLVPLFLGDKYVTTSSQVKELFSVMCIFPTFFLQAYLLLTLHQEKLDMQLNIVSVSLNFIICLIGLTYLKDLSVVNFSIFFSTFVFHILEDIYLIRIRMITIKDRALFYLTIGGIVSVYIFMSTIINPMWLFLYFWVISALLGGIYFFVKYRKYKI